MYNKDIRNYAKEKGVFLWQVAEVMGISEPTMTRKLRTELSAEDKQAFTSIINELSERREEAEA